MIENENGLAGIRARQMVELIQLQSKHVQERRERAREEGLLVETLEDLDRNLSWEIEKSGFGGGYQRALGKDPDGKKILAEAYRCDPCNGWVKGEPRGKRYSDVAPLSGSEGTEFHCTICDKKIGEAIERMFLTPSPSGAFE